MKEADLLHDVTDRVQYCQALKGDKKYAAEGQEFSVGVNVAKDTLIPVMRRSSITGICCLI